ncbi:hypothetical protein EON66_07695 [archaeon]|nr:MAG: hypothetical protein EON66_07695 [archaeon]
MRAPDAHSHPLPQHACVDEGVCVCVDRSEHMTLLMITFSDGRSESRRRCPLAAACLALTIVGC